MLDFDRLNALIKEKGIKKSHIAEMLGRKSRSLLNVWEAGEGYPTDADIQKLAQILSTTPEYLTGQTDIKEKQPTLIGELSPEEQEIIFAARSADPSLRRAALSVLKSAEPPAPGSDAT